MRIRTCADPSSGAAGPLLQCARMSASSIAFARPPPAARYSSRPSRARSTATATRASRSRSSARCSRSRRPSRSSRGRSRTCGSATGATSSPRRTSTTVPRAAAAWPRSRADRVPPPCAVLRSVFLLPLLALALAATGCGWQRGGGPGGSGAAGRTDRAAPEGRGRPLASGDARRRRPRRPRAAQPRPRAATADRAPPAAPAPHRRHEPAAPTPPRRPPRRPGLTDDRHRAPGGLAAGAVRAVLPGERRRLLGRLRGLLASAASAS